jgi:hypothetical protein
VPCKLIAITRELMNSKYILGCKLARSIDLEAISRSWKQAWEHVVYMYDAKPTIYDSYRGHTSDSSRALLGIPQLLHLLFQSRQLG